MAEFQRRKAEAVEHIRSCCLLYEYQLRRGKHFLHEHPWTARSWKLDCVQQLMENRNVQLVQGHMFQFGMTTHVDEKNGEQGLVKKPTGFLTSSQCIAQALNLQCAGGEDTSMFILSEGEQQVLKFIQINCARPSLTAC